MGGDKEAGVGGDTVLTHPDCEKGPALSPHRQQLTAAHSSQERPQFETTDLAQWSDRPLIFKVCLYWLRDCPKSHN